MARTMAALVAGGSVAALASLALSMYLTYVKLRVLDAICVYCVASASIMTALFVVLSAVVWRVRDEVLEHRVN